MRGWLERWRGRRSPGLSLGLAAVAALLAIGGSAWQVWTPLFMDKENAFLFGAGEEPELRDPWGRPVQHLVKRVGCCGQEGVVLSAGPNGRLESRWRAASETWHGEAELEVLGGDDLSRGSYLFFADTPGRYWLRFGDVFVVWGALLATWWLVCTLISTPSSERALGGPFHVGLMALGALVITAWGDKELGDELVFHLDRLGLERGELAHPSVYLVPFVGAAAVAALRTLSFRRRLEAAELEAAPAQISAPCPDR